MERVTVLVAREGGGHVFETIGDKRICIVSGNDPLPPDLVVLPCGQDRRFERLSTFSMPDWLRPGIATGSTGVVLDASTEGIPPKPDIVASLHDVIERLGLPPRQCVYLTGNCYFRDDYLAHCKTAGIHEPVHVLHHNYWIWESVARFAPEGERVFAERLAAFHSRAPIRPRRFISLNRTPRPFKVVLLLKLMADGLWDSGFISFGGFRQDGHPGKSRPEAGQLAKALPGFDDLIASVAPWLESLDQYGSVLIGQEGNRVTHLKQKQATEAGDLPEYDESWFSAVTETEFRARRSRITEKVMKPLVNFHPLIVFGSPGSLQMIRDYGFVTFDDVIDESYDQETDPRRRFDLAYAELVRLCRLGDSELRDLEKRASDRLTFNARWGLTQLPGIYRTQRDTALVDEILASVRGRGQPN